MFENLLATSSWTAINFLKSRKTEILGLRPAGYGRLELGSNVYHIKVRIMLPS